MVLKLVVFDLDGTLVNSVDAHAESWSFAIRTLGLASIGRSELVNLIGLPGDVIVSKVLGDVGLKHYQKIRWLKDRYFLEQLATGRITLFPDTTLCLRYVRERGFLVGLATSTPNYVLIPLLEHFELLDYFDYTVGGDEVKRGKPNPDIFVKTAERAGVDPKEALVVGDTVYDTAPAMKAGMMSVLVARGGLVNTRNLAANIVVGNLKDLSHIL